MFDIPIPTSNLHKFLTVLGLSMMITFGYQLSKEFFGENNNHSALENIELGIEHAQLKSDLQKALREQSIVKSKLEAMIKRLKEPEMLLEEDSLKINLKSSLPVEIANLSHLFEDQIRLARQTGELEARMKILTEKDVTLLFSEQSKSQLSRQKSQKTYLLAFGFLAGLAVFVIGARIWWRYEHQYYPR